MSIRAAQSVITNTGTNLAFPGKPTTRLAKPYHFRRNGIYYMRLRATVNTTDFASVPLKTSNRRDALDASEHLAGFVRGFHLENPDAPWSKLKEHFRVVPVKLFEAGRDDNVTRVWGGLHDSHSGSARCTIRSLTSVKTMFGS